MDEHIGIDYSLLRDPAVSTDTLDLDFKVNTGSCPADPPTVPMGTAVPACMLGTTERAGWAALRLQKRLLFLAQGMFFPRARENQELENHAVEPVIKETERMVYVAFSEYFFDSAMHAYFQAGVLAIELQGEKVGSASHPAMHRQLAVGRGLLPGRREGWALPAEQRRCHPGSSSAGINSNCSLIIRWFVLPAGAQGPGGFAESHLLRDHLHAGERSTWPGQEAQGRPWGRAEPCPALCLRLTCPPQSPAVDAPLRLVLQVSAPPRCIIKPSGTSVSVSAFLNISLVAPGRPPVQLSSMAMVSGGLAGRGARGQGSLCSYPSAQGKSVSHLTWEGSGVPEQRDSWAYGTRGAASLASHLPAVGTAGL